MKVWTGGRKLWTRTIGSTVFGQAVDSAIFYPIAFLGVWDTSSVITVLITNWALKVGWEDPKAADTPRPVLNRSPRPGPWARTT